MRKYRAAHPSRRPDDSTASEELVEASEAWSGLAARELAIVRSHASSQRPLGSGFARVLADVRPFRSDFLQLRFAPDSHGPANRRRQRQRRR